MFLRSVMLIFLASLMGVVLLNLRQQRIDAMHEMVALHREIRRSREAVWATQVQIAEHIAPSQLHEAIARSALELELFVPVEQQLDWQANRQGPDGETAEDF